MDFSTLSNDAIVKELSASAERNDRVWSAGAAVLKARGVWPSKASYDVARDEITRASSK